MKSNALPSFWAAYRPLDKALKRQAKKAYRLWAENPFHPSLHFNGGSSRCPVRRPKPQTTRRFDSMSILASASLAWRASFAQSKRCRSHRSMQRVGPRFSTAHPTRGQSMERRPRRSSCASVLQASARSTPAGGRRWSCQWSRPGRSIQPLPCNRPAHRNPAGPGRQPNLLRAAFGGSGRLNEGFTKAAEQINNRGPIMVDQETRLDKSVAGPGARLTYFYSLPKYSSEDINRKLLLASLEPAIKKQVMELKSHVLR
jgi:hypothetical protein